MTDDDPRFQMGRRACPGRHCGQPDSEPPAKLDLDSDSESRTLFETKAAAETRTAMTATMMLMLMIREAAAPASPEGRLAAAARRRAAGTRTPTHHDIQAVHLPLSRLNHQQCRAIGAAVAIVKG